MVSLPAALHALLSVRNLRGVLADLPPLVRAQRGNACSMGNWGTGAGTLMHNIVHQDSTTVWRPIQRKPVGEMQSCFIVNCTSTIFCIIVAKRIGVARKVNKLA
ncbi:MAG TPA: hypothetical protein VJ652_10470 [Noviherbaspirillum sp.]|nr:hypothetical protein [Noviherbaspirillum sp.]